MLHLAFSSLQVSNKYSDSRLTLMWSSEKFAAMTARKVWAWEDAGTSATHHAESKDRLREELKQVRSRVCNAAPCTGLSGESRPGARERSGRCTDLADYVVWPVSRGACRPPC